MKIKNIIAVSAAFAMLAVSAFSVSADVINEPNDDGFYSENYMQCEYIHTRYYTVKKDCFLYTNPNMDKRIMKINEGDVIIIDFSYSDDEGRVWGSHCYKNENFEYKCGWLDMANVEVIYDHYSFCEEHEDEIGRYNGEINDYTPVNSVKMWEYPADDEIKYDIPADRWFNEEFYWSVEQQAVKTWADETGDLWIYIIDVDYQYTGWISLNSFMNDSAAVSSETSVTEISTETIVTSVTTVSDHNENVSDDLLKQESEKSEQELQNYQQESEKVNASETTVISAETESSESEEESTAQTTVSESVSETSASSSATTLSETPELSDEELYSMVIESIDDVEKKEEKTMTLPIVLAISSVIISAVLIFAVGKKN